MSETRETRRAASLPRQLAWTAGAVLIIAALVFPVYWMAVLAFDDSRSILADTPVFWPRQPSLDNFTHAWDLVAGNILISTIVALSVTVITLVIAVPASYYLAQFRFRWTAVIMLGLLVAQMIPGIALGLSFYTMFAQAHLLNSYVGLILADTTYGIPFAVVLLRAFMESVPADTLAAARIDGSGEWRVFIRIAVPLATPGIITAALFAFLFAWGDFLFAVTLNGTGAVQPVTVGLYKFVGTYGSDWGGIMASVVLAIIPASVFLILAQRWLTVGVRTGGMTG
ncbi:sugar ABC transporter permease [Planotetraspora silvatica]|uniref:Sugar ABC transporter permease n=1 Tax=Planotetraspora silvatica TaxID=234614 RepID=A0A8J3UKM5_9ACTN|nr:carbohydrate ABC transporter permease [Planotetraspora silvatica]GII47574.1 sugar ABC transporter permease [Planotetraspora silvatica]